MVYSSLAIQCSEIDLQCYLELGSRGCVRVTGKVKD